MAQRLLLPTTRGHVAEPVEVPIVEGQLTEAGVTALNSFMRTVAATLNGGLSFGDGTQSTRLGNFRGHTIEFVTPSVADTEFEVPHGLKEIPVGRLILDQDKAGTLYASRRGAWSKTRVFFRCDVASVTFLIGLV